MIKHVIAVGMVAIAIQPVQAILPTVAYVQVGKTGELDFNIPDSKPGGVVEVNAPLPHTHRAWAKANPDEQAAEASVKAPDWVSSGSAVPGVFAENFYSLQNNAFAVGRKYEPLWFGADYTFKANMFSERTLNVTQQLANFDPAVIKANMQAFADAYAANPANTLPMPGEVIWASIGASTVHSSASLIIQEDNCIVGTCGYMLSRGLLFHQGFLAIIDGDAAPNDWKIFTIYQGYESRWTASLDAANGWEYTSVSTNYFTDATPGITSAGAVLHQTGNDALDVNVVGGRSYTWSLGADCRANMFGAAYYIKDSLAQCNAVAYWNGITDIRDGTGLRVNTINVTSGTGFYYSEGSPLSPAPPPPTIPEPSQWAMLIAGFGLVGGVLRRRRDGRISVGKA